VYAYLAPEVTERVSHTSTFDVAAGSTTTFYMRGGSKIGEAGVWRRDLTLIYIPD